MTLKWRKRLRVDSNGAYRPPFLCRIGLHRFGYGDGSRCVSVTRCHRCNAAKSQFHGEWQEGCRRLVTEGRHPEMPWSCLSLLDAEGDRGASASDEKLRALLLWARRDAAMEPQRRSQAYPKQGRRPTRKGDQ